jgi:hypothetical protein
MSFLDELNRFTNPLKKLVLVSPAHELLSSRMAVLSFTCQQTGGELSFAADYIREERVLYLMVDHSQYCLKNLETGSTVKIRLDGKQYEGWAEGLTGYDEFFRILSLNSERQAELFRRYGWTEKADGMQSIAALQDFLQDYKLIRIKLSGKS